MVHTSSNGDVSGGLHPSAQNSAVAIVCRNVLLAGEILTLEV